MISFVNALIETETEICTCLKSDYYFRFHLVWLTADFVLSLEIIMLLLSLIRQQPFHLDLWSL